MDKFANLADALPINERRVLWRSSRTIAVEGRKAGVHLDLALQDPTHKSLDLRIQRNCLPLSFRVKDGDARRVILGAGAAEQLPLNQFMTVTDHLLCGVAFAPSDEEISSFLAARTVASYLAYRGWRRMLYWQRPRTSKEMKSNNEIHALLGRGWSLRAVQGELLDSLAAARLMRQLRPFTAK